jgi:hypothetical protein
MEIYGHSIVFVLVSAGIPLLTIFVLPPLLDAYVPRRGNLWWLVSAGLLFFISYYLPSPLIEGKDTAAVTHFVGGGLYSGLVWLYLKQRFNWKAGWVLELISLLALVSLLGVANELFELFVDKTGIYKMTLADTSWDLLMNTLGALTVFLIYSVKKLF